MIPVDTYSGQPVAVMGLGRSGIAAALALGAGDAHVWGWDDGEDARDAARQSGVPLVDLYQGNLSEAAALILSPGIPHLHPEPHPLALKARDAGCEIICDIELLARTNRDAAYICITGTNGKSTTTALVGHIMTGAGRRVEMGGNLGVPALDLEVLGAGDSYLLELSSYQLELSPGLQCDIAVLLNITPDHLDRHGGWEGYVAAKKCIFDGCGTSASAIIGIDGEACREIQESLSAQNKFRVIPISANGHAPGGVYVLDGHLIDDMDNGQVRVLDLSGIGTLPGTHNWENACAAYAAARSAGLEPDEISRGLKTYPGLAHRQEL
ncbi:MAG: Mur ligase family protein, partial [Rhodospirillales bacterium]|nr:Mur ligase family protein [Rhodospirillales bacterium]